jgi:hypothetical protein
MATTSCFAGLTNSTSQAGRGSSQPFAINLGKDWSLRSKWSIGFAIRCRVGATIEEVSQLRQVRIAEVPTVVLNSLPLSLFRWISLRS